MLALPSLPPLALYVHFPWCVRKCPYCDFNSHALKPLKLAGTSASAAAAISMVPIAPIHHATCGHPDPAQAAAGNRNHASTLSTELQTRYLDALIADLEASLPAIWGRPVHTVFLGGGTPSLFAPESIDRLLAALRARLPLRANAEITLEANPGTLECGALSGYRQAGITRVSLGVQSFDPRRLAALGRIHSADEACVAAYELAQHFTTFNLDLMFALPAQTVVEALADLDTALACSPPHLSFYHLTIEPHTAFHRRPPAHLPDAEQAADMYEALAARLAAAGYLHYETSAWAQPGHAAQHNLNYWQFGDYLGIGAGAHSKLSFPDRIVRQMRHRHPDAYLRASDALGGCTDSASSTAHAAIPGPGTYGAVHPFLQHSESVSRKSLALEFMMNALRLVEGFPTAWFFERTGLALSTVEAPLQEAERLGLIVRTPTHIAPTLRGQQLQNPLLQLFVPDAMPLE